MANEWQSLLQASPNNANFNLVKSFQDSYGTAQEQKKTAYEQFRLQKAQDIASQATRDDGSMDWDKMFQLGRDAGIGLDAFNQVHKMQMDRRASEVAVKQGQMALGAMGYDNADWDKSARPISYIPAGGTPYVATDEAHQSQYDFITNPSQPELATQTPVAPAAQAPVSIPAQTDLAPSENEDGAIRIVGQAPASKAPMYELPEAPAMDREYMQQGYFNELWRAGRNKTQDESIGAGLVGPGARQLSIANMDSNQRKRFAEYATLNGITGNAADQLGTLEDMAVASIPVPKLNPMVGMLSRDDMAKEYGRYEQAKADYLAKVQEARNKLAESIASGNYTAFDKQLAKQSSERAAAQRKEEHAEFERKRAAAEKLVEMGITSKPVSDENVTALQDKFVPGLEDISKARKSFANAMAAAISKAKIDGTVSMDAVISNLVAMGAMPSKTASEILVKMSPEAYTAFGTMAKAGTIDAVKNFINRFTSLGLGEGSGATSDTWVEDALDNIGKQAISHGMRPEYLATYKPWQSQSPSSLGTTPPPTSSEKKPALRGDRASKKGR